MAELQSAEFQSLQLQSVTMTVSRTDTSPPVRHVDVMTSTHDVMTSTRGSAATAGSDNDDVNEEYDNFDNDNVVTSRHAPVGAGYLRQARMSICKMTADYIRRLPGSRKDRSATRRERKATKTLAIVLGMSITSQSH